MGHKVQALAIAAGLTVASLPVKGWSQANGGDYFIGTAGARCPNRFLGGTVIPYKEVTLAARPGG